MLSDTVAATTLTAAGSHYVRTEVLHLNFHLLFTLSECRLLLFKVSFNLYDFYSLFLILQVSLPFKIPDKCILSPLFVFHFLNLRHQIVSFKALTAVLLDFGKYIESLLSTFRLRNLLSPGNRHCRLPVMASCDKRAGYTRLRSWHSQLFE